MATKFTAIYDKALLKMREYDFLDMEDEQVYDVLSSFLQSAETDFDRICLQSLSDKDEESESYNADLSGEEIEILALGIICHWSTAYVADADKWRNALGTKDFSVFSPANLLNVTASTRDNFFLEYQDKMNRYSFLYGDLIRDQVRR